MEAVRQVGYIIGFDYHHRGVLVQFPEDRKPLWRDSYRELDNAQGMEIFKSRVESAQPAIELNEDIVRTSNDRLEGPFFILKNPRDSLKSTSSINSLQDDAKIQGNIGKRAAEKLEIQSLWKETQCIEPVHSSDIKDPSLIVPSKFFTKEKRDALDVFQRNKSRLVARGDKRSTDSKEIGDTYSPTVSYPTVLLTLNLILAMKLEYATADFTSAYLNSEFKGNLFMSLNPYVAGLMVEIDSKAKDFLQQDGSMFVKIKRGLYGLQESAKLWYETLAKDLIQQGYVCSKYDQAMFNKIQNDRLDLILVYVDDMLLAGSKEIIESLKDKLKSKFVVNFSPISPDEFDYIGMHVKYDKEDESFLVSQPAMVGKILKGVQDYEEVPYDSKLFVVTESELLIGERITKFRSELIEMSYLTKTRNDLILPVAFLSTRMQPVLYFLLLGSKQRSCGGMESQDDGFST